MEQEVSNQEIMKKLDEIHKDILIIKERISKEKY